MLDIDAFETIVRKGKYINREVEPGVALETADGNSGVQWINGDASYT